jgi:hypothetical protein
MLLAALAILAACSGGSDPLSRLDARYTDVMVDLSVADRDTTRNVHNKEARRRKVAAEKARIAFFANDATRNAIEAALAEPSDDRGRVKAEGYKRHMLVAAAWTEEEKAEETRLLGRLDEAGAAEATWTSPDGKVEVDLTEDWTDASAPADGLSEDMRRDLAREYVAHQMSVVGPDLQDLVRLRNEVARRASFSNYWELGLAGQGLSPGEVDQIIEELRNVVGPVNRAIEGRAATMAAEKGLGDDFANRPLLRRAAGLEAGRDQADDYFDTDRAEERVTSFFQDMGIPTDGWQVYTGPTRYVRSGVYGFPIRPPDHVAIVMSQDRRWSLWQYEALAHEGGHATWWKNIEPDSVQSPVLWEPPAPWFEGFAQFFERLVYSPAFTARYVPELPEEQRRDLDAWRARNVAEAIADSIVDTQVERRLYEDPTNLEAICRFAAEKRAEVRGRPWLPPADDHALVYDRALLSSLLWNYPAYSQNYLFAYLAEAWMFRAVESAVGEPVGNPKVGPLLTGRVVRGPVTATFPDRLEALLPGARSEALRQYVGAGMPEQPALQAAAAP